MSRDCSMRDRHQRAVYVGLILVSVAALSGNSTMAETPLTLLRYSPDVTVDLSVVTADDHELVTDDLGGSVNTIGLGIPENASLDGYCRAPNGDNLFSLDTTAALVGGLISAPGDVVRFDGVNYTTEFSAVGEGLPANVNVDAVGMDSQTGDLLLSFDITLSVDAITVDDEDVVRFDGLAFTSVFDGSTEGIDDGLDLNGVHYLDPTGNLLLSFDGSGSVAGIAFDDEDILEHATVGAAWELAFDGSTQHASWLQADLVAIDAVTAAAGGVPNGDDVAGMPLFVSKATGNDVRLHWGESCLDPNSDYAVYEGTLGNFTSHRPVPSLACTTNGNKTATFSPATGSRYFLIVPQGSVREGTYGTGSDGTPRPVSLSACQAQLVKSCS